MQVRRSNRIARSRMATGLAALLLIGSTIAGLANQASATSNRTPLDSFLTTQVTSVNELVYEVNSNPKISARYGKLFHIPSSEVATYFKSNLIIETLTHNYYGPVYSVRPNTGLIFVTFQHISAGTKVYALRSGRPILKWACGNPLSATLPIIKLASSDTTGKGNKGKIEEAQSSPSYGHHSGDHGQPLSESTNTYQPPTDVFEPNEQVLPYQSTYVPQDFGHYADFNVPAGTSFPFNFPVSDFWAGVPVTYIAFRHTPTSEGGGAPAPEIGTATMWALSGLALGLAIVGGRRKKALTNI